MTTQPSKSFLFFLGFFMIAALAHAADDGRYGTLGLREGRVYLYSCQNDYVVVRECRDQSKYKIESQADCIGPSDIVSKTNFKATAKNFLEDIDPNSLEDITPKDIKISRYSENPRSAELYQERTQKQIDNLQSKLDQIKEAASPSDLNDLQNRIQTLQSDLSDAEFTIAACKKRDIAIDKINQRIENALDTLCNRDRGIQVPRNGTLLHALLARFDSTKALCDSEEDCRHLFKFGDGLVAATVVKRVPGGPLKVQEYIKDTASTFVWSPEAPKPMNVEQAKIYCGAMTDFDLHWSLPSINEFIVAFNPSNTNSGTLGSDPISDIHFNIFNDHVAKILNTQGRFFWSSTRADSTSAPGPVFWGFQDSYEKRAFMQPDRGDKAASVHCIGHYL